jgi:AraC-like DNA-binding protein
LLDGNSRTLSEIAELMAFSSPAAFSTYTKKLLGKTPSEYRQR